MIYGDSGALGCHQTTINGIFKCTDTKYNRAWVYEKAGDASTVLCYSDGHWRIQLKVSQGTSVCFAHTASEEPMSPVCLGRSDWHVYDLDKKWMTQDLIVEPEDVIKRRLQDKRSVVVSGVNGDNQFLNGTYRPSNRTCGG